MAQSSFSIAANAKRPPQRVRRPSAPVKALAAFARSLRDDLLAAINRRRTGGTLRRIVEECAEVRREEIDHHQFAASAAQTAACLLAAITVEHKLLLRIEVVQWLARTTEPLARWLISACAVDFAENGAADPHSLHLGIAQRWRESEARKHLSDYARPPGHEPTLLHLFEGFLGLFDNPQRRRRGVYFTPPVVAAYIVDRVDRSLREEFNCQDGLASAATWRTVGELHNDGELAYADQPFVRILDPAAGAGVFLVEAIRHSRRNLIDRCRAAGFAPRQVEAEWRTRTASNLLPRLVGYELMPAACAIANMNVAVELAGAGFDFTDCPPPPVVCRDALAAPSPGGPNEPPMTVIIGNPPYSGVSHNRHPWIEALLKGRRPDGRAAASYYEADGEPINEKKLWLQDDYVKFLRWAQASIEDAGSGIVAMVTNHGYLDNITFRGMRRQLMLAFPQIDVLDLHGNRKKAERSPQGQCDENIFEIEQGVAISILRRPPAPATPLVRHADLWGSRDEKLRALSENGVAGQSSTSAAKALAPAAPYYFFTPHDNVRQREYERGLRLVDVMPINTTAPVTARDGFVVALSENELLTRMAEFRDLSIPDDEIRRRYFVNTRSAAYPPGDTRGWKLAAARRTAAADAHWREHALRCLYRPFDWRAVYWTDWMIDWPRTPVMQHLLAGDNLALIARRQMLSSRPCDYFWIADGVALDGVVRSDNRGSESLFPLYVDEAADGAAAAQRRANFDAGFVSQFADRIGLIWRPAGSGDLTSTFGPPDLLHYIYACFHSSQYRQRYADCLRLDFPRVFITGRQELFRTLCRWGKRLVDLHLLWVHSNSSAAGGLSTRVANQPGNRRSHNPPSNIAPGYPRLRHGRVAINAETTLVEIDNETWAFQVGAHQVCRKWLRDRRGRELGKEEIAHYQQLVAAVRETIAVVGRIDDIIGQHGGWPDAFAIV